MTENNSLFEFVSEVDSNLFDFLIEFENDVFTSPKQAVLNGRVCLELIVDKVITAEDLTNEMNLVQVRSLSEKLAYLYRKGFIDDAVEKVFRTIRIEGNTVAHTSDTVEISKSTMIHKKLYDAIVWYVESYGDINIRIPKYKNPPVPTSSSDKEIEVGIQKLFESGKLTTMLGLEKKEIEVERTSDTSNDTSSEVLQFVEEQKSNKGYLLPLINKLKISSSEAIDHPDQFDFYKKYMHVDRKIDHDVKKILKERTSQRKNLVLICGDVGDGKSHLLATLKNSEQNLIQNYSIINDASESDTPFETALETLERKLAGFSDELLDQQTNQDHVIVAVNMGILNNFIYNEHSEYHFEALKKFIEESGIFTNEVVMEESNGVFDLVSFGDYHIYELTNDKPTSEFFTDILEKITSNSDDNPYWYAFKKDQELKVNSIIHQNFRLLMIPEVKAAIVQLLIKVNIVDKVSISSRDFFDIIADLLIPSDFENELQWTEEEFLERTLPTLLFSNTSNSKVFTKLKKYNPINSRNEEIDQLVIELNTLDEQVHNLIDLIKSDEVKNLLLTTYNEQLNESTKTDSFVIQYTIFRYLTDQKFYNQIEEVTYTQFIKYLYEYNRKNIRGYKGLFEEVKNAVYKWQGNPKKDLNQILLTNDNDQYLFSQKLELKFAFDRHEVIDDQVLKAFQNQIELAYRVKNSIEKIELDYSLYHLLNSVNEGYRPNKSDKEKAINFTQFITRLMENGDKDEEITIYSKKSKNQFKLCIDDFGDFEFTEGTN